MINGITVGVHNVRGLGFDYWLDKKCTSGYQHGTNSLGLVFGDYFKGKLRASVWDEWSPRYKLAVPEQLVWWGEDD